MSQIEPRPKRIRHRPNMITIDLSDEDRRKLHDLNADDCETSNFPIPIAWTVRTMIRDTWDRRNAGKKNSENSD